MKNIKTNIWQDLDNGEICLEGFKTSLSVTNINDNEFVITTIGINHFNDEEDYSKTRIFINKSELTSLIEAMVALNERF